MTKLDRLKVARVLAGQATEEDYHALGRENVLAIKSDTGARHYFQVSHAASRVASADRTYEFVCADDNRVRNGDRVAVKGWDLSAFKRNPIMLWGHNDFDAHAVLGTWPDMRKEPPQLIGRAEFLPAGVNDVADLVEDLVARKVVRACSVGFQVHRVSHASTPEEAEQMDIGEWGVLIEKAELHEVSIVSVGMNPRALRHSLREAIGAAGIDPSEERVERFLRACPEDADDYCRQALGRCPPTVFDMGAARRREEPAAHSCGCHKAPESGSTGAIAELRRDLESRIKEQNELFEDLTLAVQSLASSVTIQPARRRGVQPNGKQPRVADAEASVSIAPTETGQTSRPDIKAHWVAAFAKFEKERGG